MAMTHQQALEILAQHRGERIVIATMASIGFWPRLSEDTWCGPRKGYRARTILEYFENALNATPVPGAREKM